ncbi:hypothetical protein BD779DRAFT_1673267 [Infundibulicybe gibba]|nr:hypothetical protein BD779DRAFT_1673267 [Infundibulicybe gibba]
MNNWSPDWVSAIIYEFLVTLPELRTLHLTNPVCGGRQRQIPLNCRISNITKLTFRGCLDVSEIVGSSPGLSHLDLEYPIKAKFGERIPTFHDLISKVPADRPMQLYHLRIHGFCIRLDHQTLPHLRQLRSLALGDIPWIMEPLPAGSDKFALLLSDIWGVIRREALPIEEAITPVNTVVLNHLAALNGLRKLVITRVISRTNSRTLSTRTHLSASSDVENEVLARNIFAQVMLRHCKTLVSLNIPSMFEGPLGWFLGSSVEDLLECVQLTELSIIVDLAHMGRRTPNDIVVSCSVAPTMTVANEVELERGSSRSSSVPQSASNEILGGPRVPAQTPGPDVGGSAPYN